MDYILVIDTGTSSMRGLLMNEKGQITLTHQIPHFMKIESNGTAEQNSLVFRNSLIDICQKTARACLLEDKKIVGLSFTSQRSSVLPVDGSGNALYNTIMWYDKRSLDICDCSNRSSAEEIYYTCGMKSTPVLSASKMAWLKKNMPEIYKNSYKLIGIHDYLLFLCTGKFITDTSLASRTGLLNITNTVWDEKLLMLYGIDIEKLCDISPVGKIVGSITKEFSESTGILEGIPVISAGGDQQCSLLGQRLMQPGQANITSGTASYVAALSDKPIFDSGMRTNLNISALEGKWVVEASNMSSGAVYQWMKELLFPKMASFQEINQAVATTSAGSNGLLMLPCLAGKGCPQWDCYARGSFYNIGFETTKNDFARACLESIADETADCFSVLCECAGEIHTLTSSGGLAGFSAFNQMLADMTGQALTSCLNTETTGTGAWALAACALALYPSPAAALDTVFATSPDAACFLPNPSNFSLYKKQSLARKYIIEHLDSKKLQDMISG